jgi:ribosomal protein S18 acetylase RimI-like enzyme
MEKIDRYYFEITSIKNFKGKNKPSDKIVLELLDNKNFELNKFFYKQIGKKHQWVDRLVWKDKDWIKYVSNENLKTYIIKEDEELVGYFELIFDKNECEIAYFGILEEYIGKSLGGYLLSEAIKIAFEKKVKRIWVHTCSLDHQNAFLNYQARGMTIFKTEELKRKVV